jgi:hypothetical protein
MSVRQRLLLCLISLFPFQTSGASPLATSQSPHLPFTFVENKGQLDSSARYMGAGPTFRAWFQDRGVLYQQGLAMCQVQFKGGSPNPRIEAADPTGASANYFRGADTRRWKTHLPLFGALLYREVWPGIDIRFRAEEDQTKAEYLVSPGGSVGDIQLLFDAPTEIQSDGSLAVFGASGRFVENKPFIFQDSESGKVIVQGGFRREKDGTIGFTVAAYDPQKPLVIDPIILFGGYFGGSAQSSITSVAVNSYFNTIVAGWTLSTDLPSSGGALPLNRGGVDAFVAGFSPAGGKLLFCTYLGGSADDRAFGIAVDSSNNTYITGWTSSSNFPVVAAFQSRLSGVRDAFVTKLNPAGNALIYSTYLGGGGVDAGNAITLDTNNSPVIVGDTTSTNLPASAGAVQSRSAGGQDAFVAKLTPKGAALMFMTYLGGSATDHGAAVVLDASGSVFVAGSTFSTNFHVANASQPQSGGGEDAFVAKFSPSGSSLLFSTYFGGSGGTAGAPEAINAITMGSAGNLFVAGITSSPNLPVTSTAAQTVFAGGQTDGFLARLDPATGSVLKCTYLGGSGDDGINGLAIDFYGYLYVAGYTSSTDFPVQSPAQSANAGGMDAFVAKMLPSYILFSTYMGGVGNETANAIAIDSLSSVVIAGQTGSAAFTGSATLTGWTGSAVSSFLVKLAPGFTLAVNASGIFYFDVWHNTGYNGPNLTLNASSFGTSGDLPVVGDWDASGRQRIGVFRSGSWYLDTNGNGVLDSADRVVQFGQEGDLPVVGDWSGTGRASLGLYRQGTFILDLSGHLSGIATGLKDATFPFGLPGDLPVVADWNRSGTSKVGVFRNGTWLVDYNGDRIFNSLDKIYTYGAAGDIPVVGDWTGSGAPSLGVYRHGIWILDYNEDNVLSSGRELTLTFGGAGYTPLVLSAAASNAPQKLNANCIGGPEGIRTLDLFHAMEARSQLRHRPTTSNVPLVYTNDDEDWYIFASEAFSPASSSGCSAR